METPPKKAPFWTLEFWRERAKARKEEKRWKERQRKNPEGHGMTLDEYKAFVQEKDAEQERQNQLIKELTAKHHPIYVSHLDAIGRLGPKAIQEGKKITPSARAEVLRVLEGIAWMDRRAGRTEMIQYNEVYSDPRLEKAARQVSALTTHPDEQIRKAAANAYEKMWKAFDRIPQKGYQ